MGFPSANCGRDRNLIFSRKTIVRSLFFACKEVFGKWCRPNYNSVVATFCHNIARDLPIAISDPALELNWFMLMMLAACFFIGVMDGRLPVSNGKYRLAAPTYRITLGALAEMIHGFRNTAESALPYRT